MRRKTTFALLIAMSSACLAVAQDGSSSGAAKRAAAPTKSTASDQAAQELAAIRATSEAFVAAFNKADAKAIAAMWTSDGEYIDDAGRAFVGRQAIEKSYADFFAGNTKSKIHILIDSVRLLGENSAVEDGRAFVEPAPAGAPGTSRYTVFHVKVDGKWLMASVRDSWVEAPSAYKHVADLEWLIGDWSAEEHGAKHESACRWVADKSFVERKYSITLPNGTKTSGVQMIGWEPQAGHVQSWDFSPDGGYAVGVWSARPDGWMAHLRGVTGDGAPTSSVNSLRRLDDDAYVWQSVQRSVGGVALPDTDEVVIKRQPTGR